MEMKLLLTSQQSVKLEMESSQDAKRHKA